MSIHNPSARFKKGFSLLELLIYMALLALIMVAIVNIFIAVGGGKARNEVQSEVNANLRFAVEKIEDDLRAATSITTPASGSGVNISFIQGASTTLSSGSSISMAFASSVTAGNTIVVAVGWYTTSTASVADSAGNTYTSAVTSSIPVGVGTLQIFYAKNVTGGAINVTSTFSPATQYMRMGIHEYSGLDISAPFDVAASADATSSGSMNPVSGTSTTNFANELLFGSVYIGATTNPNAGANFTLRIGYIDFGTEDRIVSSTGSYSAPWSTTTSTAWLATMATFKAGGGGGTSSALTFTTASDTIAYCVISGVLRRQTGGGACATSSDAITDSTVSVGTSTFTLFQNTNSILSKTVNSVQIDISLTYNGAGSERQYTEEKITTVALRN